MESKKELNIDDASKVSSRSQKLSGRRGTGGGVDLNCDLGEGAGNDERIMPYITSANIACGFHAGDENTMKKAVQLSCKYGVHIGAHPSYPDRENFGRTDFHLPLGEVYDMVIQQIRLLAEIAENEGSSLHHVKPHGALYNMAARSKRLAAVFALAVKDADEKLIIYGLSGSHLITEAKKIGVKTASEVFADRSYQDDGRLTPRSKPDALMNDTGKVVQQVLQMIKEGTLTTISGKVIPIRAETICIHGDGEHAVVFAKAIHETIEKLSG